MSTLDHLRRLRQHFTQEQAEDILAVIETHSVTRDYLDSSLALTREHLDHRLGLTRAEFETRLEAMEKRLIMWGIGLTGVIVTLVTTLDRAIPR